MAEEEEESNEMDRITVVDDEGNELNCAVIAVAEVGGTDYALLAEETSLADEDNDTLELLIFEYDEDEESGGVVLTGIESEETFQMVQAFFQELLENNEED